MQHGSGHGAENGGGYIGLWGIYVYALVNEQLDPENHNFLEETNLSTPIWQGLC